MKTKMLLVTIFSLAFLALGVGVALAWDGYAPGEHSNRGTACSLAASRAQYRCGYHRGVDVGECTCEGTRGGHYWNCMVPYTCRAPSR